MKINQEKTKIMVFNMTKKWQFPPEIGFQNQKFLEITKQSKILGVIISNDLKWSQNTQFIVEKALRRIWTLRRMKKLGLSNEVIFYVYIEEIRSILEFGCPVWNGGISKGDVKK